ncbi:DUF3800 domain-containing protein [bacterium]|nr:DUF3800 domain-containing protein [bacterium]
MHLAYIDETKYEEKNPFFFIGGIIVKDDAIDKIEKIITQIQYDFFGTSVLSKENELHGKDIYHRKANFNKRELKERVELFKQIGDFLINNKITIRLVCIDVNAHKRKYKKPEPEYRLGLMLILERICDFLEKVHDIGVVFADYEQDEIGKSIFDFSQFKHIGKTPMYYGRPLGRLKDTIYFTHSHHSRFLQLADIVVFLANRYENNINKSEKWHDVEIRNSWEEVKKKCDYSVQRWP